MVLAADFNQRRHIDGQDPVTGFDARNAVRDALFTQLKQQENAFLIEADFLNLGNLNEAMGRSFANDFMRLASHFLIEELQRFSPKTLYAHRIGGDEASLLVSGLSTEAIEEALSLAEAKTKAFVGEDKLGLLQHRKEGRPTGIGLKTAFVQINADDKLSIVRNRLQIQIGELKNDSLLSDQQGMAPEVFHTHAAARMYSIPKTDTPLMWADIQTASLIEKFASQPIDERSLLINDLAKEREAGEAHLLRVDIKNFSALNQSIGPENADSLMADFKQRLFDVIKKQGLQGCVRLYHTGGDNLDFVCDGLSTERTQAFKNALAHQWEKTLSAQNYGTIDDNVGLYIIDTPMQSGNPYGTLDYSDLIKQSYELHGISHVEQTISGESVIHFHEASRSPEIVPLIEAQTLGVSNKLLTASYGMNEESFAEIFTKPVGQIAALTFGINLSPILTLQHKIKVLIAEGVDTKEIEDNLGQSIDGFNAYFERVLPDSIVKNFKMLELPNNATELPIRGTRTMDLAKRYGFVDAVASNLILQGQGAQRILNDLKAAAAFDKEAAQSALEQDVPKWILFEDNADIRQVQAANHLLNFIKKAETLAGEQFLDNTALDAFETIALHAFQKMGENAEAVGKPAINNAVGRFLQGAEIDVMQAMQRIQLVSDAVEEAVSAYPQVQTNISSVSQSLLSTLQAQPLKPTLESPHSQRL